MDENRVTAYGRQLARAHDDLRRRLEDLRAGQPGTASLSAHCLAFCEALTTHHRGEDAGMFAALLRVRPDLTGTVAKLVEDHELIAGLLAGLGDDPSESDLDGVAAIMESHFTFEERTIGAALDAVPDTGWTGPVFRFAGGQV